MHLETQVADCQDLFRNTEDLVRKTLGYYGETYPECSPDDFFQIMVDFITDIIENLSESDVDEDDDEDDDGDKNNNNVNVTVPPPKDKGEVSDHSETEKLSSDTKEEENNRDDVEVVTYTVQTRPDAAENDSPV